MSIAADVDVRPVVERSPSTALADRQAFSAIKPYQGMVAWPTVWLGFGVVASFVIVVVLAVERTIPLWAGLLLNTLIAYTAQTPLHEACHGNIAGRESHWMWLNHLTGYLCGTVLLHEYKAFRAMHLMHHRDTNDPELDPDNWVKAKHPLMVLLKCLTIISYYNHFFFKHIAFKPEVPGNKKLAAHIIGMYATYYLIAIALSFLGYWREVLALWLIPHILGSALIIFFFAYLTHEPYSRTERYRDTNLFWVKGRFERITNWLYLFQNFHLIHHLFPRVPFYLYGKAFRDVRPVLDDQGAHIYEFGDGKPVR